METLALNFSKPRIPNLNQGPESLNGLPEVYRLQLILFLKKLFKILIQFLKVTFHLQLLQNIGSIPCVVQYIPEPILHPIVYTSHCPTPILSLPV